MHHISKFKSVTLLSFLLVVPGLSKAQEVAKLKFHYDAFNGLSVVISSKCHQEFGVGYPLTYKIGIPSGSGGLICNERYSSQANWSPLPTKTDTDYFDGIQAARFDYTNDVAYLSAAFSPTTDTLFLDVTDSAGNSITPDFQGIARYYDNRQAVVTVTADDWSDWVVTDGRFPTLVDLFRSYGLYTTIGVITGSCSAQTWAALQTQIQAGYVEVASHSRTHPATPYQDAVGEVIGSKDDILSSVSLPSPFRVGRSEYIYTWIAPYGDYDSTVDSLLGVGGYLDARLYANLDTTSPRIYIYGDSTLSDWDASRNHFAPFFPTVELGAPSWGGGDTSLTSLNGLYDKVVANGGVYHVMWHPQVIYDDRNKSYLTQHLSYISGHKNIWYANLGMVYLYHLMQEQNASALDQVAERTAVPEKFQLLQNYPNPFNPTTTIGYRLSTISNVTLKVYDVLGREVATLVDGVKTPGVYTVQFDGSRLSSGVYFCRLEAGGLTALEKLLLLK